MRLTALRSMALLLVVVLASCRGALTQTAEPTSSAPSQSAGATQLVTPNADRTASHTAAPDPTTGPTIEPTEELPPSTDPPQTEPPSSTPTVEPPSSPVWRAAADFVPSDATINDVEWGSQLVIGGSVPDPTAACPNQTSARIWTPNGPDDEDWFEAIHDVTRNASVDAVAEPYGWWALGRDGSVGCPGEAVAVFSPTDKADWYRMGVTGLNPNDEVTDVVFLEPSYQFVASGFFSGDGTHMGVWISDSTDFDSFWRRAEHPPTQRMTEALYSLASVGDLVVGFDGTLGRPAWYSSDAGERWSNSEFNPTYRFRPADAIAALGEIYAAGLGCCTLPRADLGVVLRTSDGMTWERLGPPFTTPIDDIAVMPSGLIAVAGEQTYLSPDGNTWQQGPDLPAYTAGDRLFVAATDLSVVVVSSKYAWYADAADLDPARWPRTAAEAQQPAVGDSIDYELFTHCGPNGPLLFGLRAWVPEDASLVDGDYPRSFEDLEPGVLTLTAKDRLEFRSRGGDVVRYVPTDDPPEPFPCA